MINLEQKNKKNKKNSAFKVINIYTLNIQNA